MGLPEGQLVKRAPPPRPADTPPRRGGEQFVVPEHDFEKGAPPRPAVTPPQGGGDILRIPEEKSRIYPLPPADNHLRGGGPPRTLRYLLIGAVLWERSGRLKPRNLASFHCDILLSFKNEKCLSFYTKGILYKLNTLLIKAQPRA